MTFINNPSLTEKQLAERWGLSVKTLQNWRKCGRGPKYLKLGGAVRYRMTSVEEFEQDNLIASTSHQ